MKNADVNSNIREKVKQEKENKRMSKYLFNEKKNILYDISQSIIKSTKIS